MTALGAEVAIAPEARWDMGRGLVSLLLICPKRYGKVLVSQPLPEPGPRNRGTYRFAGELILRCLPLLADHTLDPGLETSLSFSPFLCFLFLYFFFPQICQVMLGLPCFPIKLHSSVGYNCVESTNINRTFVLCVPMKADVYTWTLSVISP